jgi:hypothetical protein
VTLSLDVTLCPGDECPLRAQCVRARALPAARQDWFGRAPWDASAGRCDAFWDVASLAPGEEALRVAAYHRWQRRGSPAGSPERDWADAEAEWAARTAASLRPRAPPSDG